MSWRNGRLSHDSRRRSSTDAEPLHSEDEFVTVRPLEGTPNDSHRDIRISCPDATGLGCDIARMLFDFGLRIIEGDMSTDGKWCFLVFKVKLSRDVKPHWNLLQQRIKQTCPTGLTTVPLWSTAPAAQDYGAPFLLSIGSYDRRDFLHDLVHTLWEADVMVFKACITTSAEGRVKDMFWIHDNKLELPDNNRILQIRDMVKGCVHQRDVAFEIEAAPEDEAAQEAAAVLMQRCACADASAFLPLRRLLSRRQKEGDNGGGVVITQSDEFGTPEKILVGIDNCTTPAYSVINVQSHDRKGLVYDLTRTMKDIQFRVAYGTVNLRPKGLCEVNLFVQEVDGSRITDAELQEELVERVRSAVTLPLRIELKDVVDVNCTELLVTAFLDSGGRGRPRVTYDVTTALSSLGLCINTAEIYIDVLRSDFDRPIELHRFLIHRLDGTRLETYEEKKVVYTRVKAQLMGTDEVIEERQAAGKLQPNKEKRFDMILESLSSWNWKG